MTKPLPEVVREMQQSGRDHQRDDLLVWSAAIADHLAQLEALADKLRKEVDRARESSWGTTDAQVLAWEQQLRALLADLAGDADLERRLSREEIYESLVEEREDT